MDIVIMVTITVSFTLGLILGEFNGRQKAIEERDRLRGRDY
jgi:hypothetical protein